MLPWEKIVDNIGKLTKTISRNDFVIFVGDINNIGIRNQYMLTDILEK